MDVFVGVLYILGGVYVIASLCTCLVGCYCIASHIIVLECCFIVSVLPNMLCCWMHFFKKRNMIWKLSPEQLINESGTIEMEEQLSNRITTMESLAKVQPLEPNIKTVEHVNTRTRRFSVSKIKIPEQRPVFQPKKPKSPRDKRTITNSDKMIFTPPSSIGDGPNFLVPDEDEGESSRSPSPHYVETTRRIVTPIDIGDKKIQIDNDKIKIMRPLGEGSFGQVFIGSYKKEEGEPPITVAVKIEPIKTNNDQVERREEDRILKEVKRCIRLDHPNVVKYYGCIFTREDPLSRVINNKLIVGTESEHVSKIVMEYCEKGDLYQLIKSGPMYKNVSRKLRFSFVMGIAQGIKYLHNNRMIHRDLKPDNILISEDYEVKICDFGSSKAIQSFATKQSAHGTPAYIDPCLTAGTGPKNTRLLDIYSFGIMMWSIWTGEHPYGQLIRGKTIVEKADKEWYKEDINLDDVDEEYKQYFGVEPKIKRREPGLSRYALMMKIKMEHIRPDTSLVKKAPRGYVKLMKCCWSPNFRMRPQDMDSILMELNQMSKRIK